MGPRHPNPKSGIPTRLREPAIPTGPWERLTLTLVAPAVDFRPTRVRHLRNTYVAILQYRNARNRVCDI